MSDSTHEEKGADSATPIEPAHDVTQAPSDWKTRTVAFNAELLELCRKYEIQLAGQPEIREGLIVASIRAFDTHKDPNTNSTGPAAISEPSETTPATPTT